MIVVNRQLYRVKQSQYTVSNYYYTTEWLTSPMSAIKPYSRAYEWYAFPTKNHDCRAFQVGYKIYFIHWQHSKQLQPGAISSSQDAFSTM